MKMNVIQTPFVPTLKDLIFVAAFEVMKATANLVKVFYFLFVPFFCKERTKIRSMLTDFRCSIKYVCHLFYPFLIQPSIRVWKGIPGIRD